jgi:hypothetical protein
MQITAKENAIRDLSSLGLEGSIETFLADGIVVGGTYDYSAAVAKPNEIYIKKSFDVKIVSATTNASGDE